MLSWVTTYSRSQCGSLAVADRSKLGKLYPSMFNVCFVNFYFLIVTFTAAFWSPGIQYYP